MKNCWEGARPAPHPGSETNSLKWRNGIFPNISLNYLNSKIFLNMPSNSPKAVPLAEKICLVVFDGFSFVSRILKKVKLNTRPPTYLRFHGGLCAYKVNYCKYRELPLSSSNFTLPLPEMQSCHKKQLQQQKLSNKSEFEILWIPHLRETTGCTNWNALEMRWCHSEMWNSWICGDITLKSCVGWGNKTKQIRNEITHILAKSTLLLKSCGR